MAGKRGAVGSMDYVGQTIVVPRGMCAIATFEAGAFRVASRIHLTNAGGPVRVYVDGHEDIALAAGETRAYAIDPLAQPLTLAFEPVGEARSQLNLRATVIAPPRRRLVQGSNRLIKRDQRGHIASIVETNVWVDPDTGDLH